MKPLYSALITLGAVVALMGCGGRSNEELQQWMIEQRNTIVPKVEPITEPKRFQAKAYTVEAAIPPFSVEKLFMALRSESAGGGNSALVRPELDRRKEPLEFVPLDTVTMVGLLDKGGKRVALIRVDKLLYQVAKGEYLGQNYGLITRITDNEITLREIVQDAAGDWVERPTTLLLQERSAK